MSRWSHPNLTFVLFVCIEFNVPINNFSVMSGWNHSFLRINQYSGELMCLAQGHNVVPLAGIKPRTSRFRVQCSTTRQPRSPSHLLSRLTSLFSSFHEVGFEQQASKARLDTIPRQPGRWQINLIYSLLFFFFFYVFKALSEYLIFFLSISVTFS